MITIKRRLLVCAYSEQYAFGSPRPHFTMFSDHRRLRRWAAQVLLVWLFSLAIGMANACALGESAHHRSDSATTADVQKHHHGDEQGHAAKANCLDFCGKSLIDAPLLKVVDDGLAALGFALSVSGTWAVSAWTEPSDGHLVVDSPNLPGGPPPRIAFQRLAL